MLYYKFFPTARVPVKSGDMFNYYYLIRMYQLNDKGNFSFITQKYFNKNIYDIDFVMNYIEEHNYIAISLCHNKPSNWLLK